MEIIFQLIYRRSYVWCAFLCHTLLILTHFFKLAFRFNIIQIVDKAISLRIEFCRILSTYWFIFQIIFFLYLRQFVYVVYWAIPRIGHSFCGLLCLSCSTLWHYVSWLALDVKLLLMIGLPEIYRRVFKTWL